MHWAPGGGRVLQEGGGEAQRWEAWRLARALQLGARGGDAVRGGRGGGAGRGGGLRELG